MRARAGIHFIIYRYATTLRRLITRPRPRAAMAAVIIIETLRILMSGYAAICA